MLTCQAEPQRGPGNHNRGALSQPHSVCAEIDMPIARKCGEGCPSPVTIQLGVWGSVVSSPVGCPGRKWILCIFDVRKTPSGTLFSVSVSDGGAPQTSRGPGKLPPFLSPTLDGPAVKPTCIRNLVLFKAWK